MLNITRRMKSFPIILASLFLLAACGGSGSSSDGGSAGGGELIGTGIYGTAASGDAIASAPIRIKSQSGATTTTTTDDDGNFASPELQEVSDETTRGPYLIQIDQGNGEYLYSVAHVDNAEFVDADSERIAINIHPLTDLIIRNWFAQNNADIDTAINGNGAINNLPTAAEVQAISDEFLSILREVLIDNGASDYNDLLAQPFNADQTGFDAFLDNSQVIIDNNIINLVVNQPNTLIENTIVVNVSLDNDFTSDNDSPPTVPSDVRVLATDMDGEALIVWMSSIDDKGVSVYRVYRDGEFVGSTPYPLFFDMGLESGIVYEYTVEAIDNRGQSSGQTIAQAISLNAADTTPPPTAIDVEALEAQTVVNVDWGINGIDDVAGFDLYRGAPGSVSATVDDLIASVTSTEYADYDVSSGATYCYVVVTYDGANNRSAPTAEVCTTVSGDVDALSAVAFSTATYSVNESEGSIAISVVRTGDISAAISVNYVVSAGTATAGTDFTETSGTLGWEQSESGEKTFTVQLLENPEVEPDETVFLILDAPSALTRLGDIDEALLTINDAPQVSCVDLSTTTITIDTTLNSPCYNVNSNVDIRNGATLTINPGVRLEFAAGIALDVEDDGVLNAVGAPESPVVFTGQLPAVGYWDGIQIESLLASELANVIVEYAGNDSGAGNGSVSIRGSGRASITDSTVRYGAGYGVSVSTINATLDDFSNNVITLHEDAPVSISANQVFSIDSSSSYTGNEAINGESRDYIRVWSADVTLNQTWDTLDVHYFIVALRQDISAALTLSPGTQLVFAAGSQLNVDSDGTLKAIGTAVDPIVFTGEQASAGFWRGIQFAFNGNDNEMDHNIVEYGGGNGGNTDANVGVFSSDGKLSISNTILRHSASNGFEFGNDIDLVMNNVTSTNNERVGVIAFNDVGLLDVGSVYTGNVDDRIWLTADTVTQAQTVQQLGVPYFVTSVNTTSIAAGLTIDPGVELQFNANGGFNVNTAGTLIADGTVAEPIVFTGVQKTSGYWNGIQFTFSNNPNLINHSVIEFAGAPSGNTQALVGFFGGGSLVSNGSVTNSILRGSLTNAIVIDEDTSGDFLTGNTFEDIAGENVLVE